MTIASMPTIRRIATAAILLLASTACLKRGVTPIHTHFNHGVYEYSHGDYDAAISEYRLAIEEDTDDHQARFNLAEALESKATRMAHRGAINEAEDLRSEAEEHYHALLAARPGDLRASVNLAARELQQGEKDGAEQRLRQTIERHPRSALPRIALAAHRLRLDDPAAIHEAIELLEEALDRDPEHPDANVLLGHALVRQARLGETDARLDRARKAYRRAVDRDAGDVGAMMGLARLERQAGHPDRAASWLRRALYVLPDLLAAHLMLSEILDARGDLEEATVHLWRGRQLEDPSRPRLADDEYSRRLLELYRRLGERERRDE